MIGSGGSGKTLLGLHFALAGVRAGEPVVFLGFHEDRRQLLLKADAFNLGQELRAALAPGGGLTLLHYPAVELDADALADQLLGALDGTGARRLVIDSIAVVERAVSEGSSPRRVQNYLSALIAALQRRRISALFTKETGPLAGSDLELETDLSSRHRGERAVAAGRDLSRALLPGVVGAQDAILGARPQFARVHDSRACGHSGALDRGECAGITGRHRAGAG